MGEAAGLPPGFPDRIGTLGSGPFDESDFDEFLEQLGATVASPTPGISVVVAGRTDWEDEDLTSLVFDRAGSTLRVYSQEMLLSWILSAEDPFDESDEFLRHLAGDHPALEFLMDFGFDWPTTQVWMGSGPSPDSDWPKIGLLRRMGYQVGKTAGRSPAERRQVLRRVFESNELPRVKSAAHMREWGGARSTIRLRKLANALSSFCKNQKRKERPSSKAIDDWESDLAWAKREFYDGRFDFEWPGTYTP